MHVNFFCLLFNYASYFLILTTTHIDKNIHTQDTNITNTYEVKLTFFIKLKICVFFTAIRDRKEANHDKIEIDKGENSSLLYENDTEVRAFAQFENML